MTQKYYKAFNRDLQCRGFQYQEGKTYEIDGQPELCNRGFHFCKDLVLTLDYYPISSDICENKYAEIEVIGDVAFEQPNQHKGVTNKIKIIRVLADEEVRAMVDGYYNSGNCNSGYYNSGNYNSGSYNSGNWNSCDRETGFFNSEQSKTVRVFNKDCDRELWERSIKPNFLYFDIDKSIGYQASFQKSFEKATQSDIELLKALPNFDADVFFEISGIRIS